MCPDSLPLAWFDRLPPDHDRLAGLAGNLVSLLPMLAISLALGAFINSVLVARRTAYLLLFVLAAAAAIYLINPQLRTYSYHGMVHLGYVYVTQRTHWPPEDPYMAGTPLSYPWAYHALVGGISSLFAVSASWVFALCNLAALAVTIIVVGRTSRLLGGDGITANVAVVIAVLAPTFLGTGARMVLEPLVPPSIEPALVDAFWFDRALPPLEKYLNVAPMALGMAFGVYCNYLLLVILKDKRLSLHKFFLLFSAVALLGYFYPFLWLAACVAAVVCGSVAARAGEWRKAFALAAALAIANLAVAPYILALAAARSPGHGMGLLQDPYLMLARLLHIEIVLLPLWFFIALGRRDLIERLREGSSAHRAALGSALVLLLAFILLDLRTDDAGEGYKFRVMAVFWLAPLAAPGLRRIYVWNRTCASIVLAIQLLPLCYDGYLRSPGRWGSVAEPNHWQGAVLRHDVQAQDRLYQWIRERTPSASILVDNKPYVPVYSRRSLFVARQFDWNPDLWQTRHDGWLFHPFQWLDFVNGHPVDDIKRRYRLVDALYGNPDERSGEELIRELDEMTDDRPVFLVARIQWQKAALESRPRLRKVAEENSWAIYALDKAAVQE